MDFMEGGSLTDTLGPTVDFKETYIAYVCREILLALAFMHHQFRLHRDIKSDNVLVRRAHFSPPKCFCFLSADFFFFPFFSLVFLEVSSDHTLVLRLCIYSTSSGWLFRQTGSSRGLCWLAFSKVFDCLRPPSSRSLSVSAFRWTWRAR